MVICVERGGDLHMVQLMPLPLTVSCLSKIQIGFTFLVPAHLGIPRKRAIKRVCVCVTDIRLHCHHAQTIQSYSPGGINLHLHIAPLVHRSPATHGILMDSAIFPLLTGMQDTQTCVTINWQQTTCKESSSKLKQVNKSTEVERDWR